MIGTNLKPPKKGIRYILWLGILIGFIVEVLCGQRIVKADDTTDLQGMLNENSSVVQNAPSTESATVNTIAPLAATTTASGTFGTCNWDIDEDGLLTIHAGVLGAGMGNWVVGGINNSSIKNVVCEPGVVANKDSSHLFNELSAVETIDISNLDTSNVVNMSEMLSTAYHPTVNTGAANATLTNIIGVNSMDTSNVVNMSGLFKRNTKLSYLNLTGLNFDKVEDASYLFEYDLKLTQIDGLDTLNTSNIENFNNMFNYTKMTTMNGIVNWNMSSATKISSMFGNMTNLTYLDLSNWDVSNVEDMGALFYYCTSLKYIDGLKNWNYYNNKSLYDFFYSNTVNQSLHDIEGWDTSNVTNMAGLFGYCYMSTLDLSNWNTSNVTNMSSMFSYTKYLTKITGITNFDTRNVTNMNGMFQSSNMNTIDLSSFNTSNVTDMGSMFQRSLATNIIGNFDTSKVKNIQYMFDHFSVDNYDNMDLNVLNWNLGKCTNFYGVFEYNSNLTSIDLSNWDTDSATDMSFLFNTDPKLEYVNLSEWNVSKVTNMRNMFDTDSNLSVLDMSGWDTSRVTNMTNMFYLDSSLWKLTLGPKTKLLTGTNSSGTNVGASFPTPPAKNTEINDPSTEQKYYSISNRWQEVNYDNGGTDHNPAGELFSSDGLNTTTRADNTMYVWQQQPYMDVSMEVPDLSYGKAAPNQGIVGRTDKDWGITVKNNVYPVSKMNTTITVEMESQLSSTDGQHTIDDSFIFRDNDGVDKVLGTYPTEIFDGSLGNGSNVIKWDANHGFLLNLQNRDTPMANYSAKLDWTMVNSI